MDLMMTHCRYDDCADGDPNYVPINDNSYNEISPHQPLRQQHANHEGQPEAEAGDDKVDHTVDTVRSNAATAKRAGNHP